MIKLLFASASNAGGGLRVHTNRPWVGLRIVEIEELRQSQLDPVLRQHRNIHDRAYLMRDGEDPVLLASLSKKGGGTWVMTRDGRVLVKTEALV